MKQKVLMAGILCIFAFEMLLGNCPVAAQEPQTATVRTGIYPDYVRIVFVTTEDIVKKACVSSSGNNIKVSFTSPLLLDFTRKETQKSQRTEKGIIKGDVSVEIVKGVRISGSGNLYTITAENLERINVSRMASPPRLVIDVYIAKSAIGTPVEKPSATFSKEGGSLKFDSLVIDAGHGGYDYGIHGRDFVEKDIALSFAKELANAIAKRGKKAFLTRKSDHVLSIKDRIKFINLKSPGFFISIHISSRNEFAIYTAYRKTPKPSEDLKIDFLIRKNGDVDSIANGIAKNIREDFGINVRQEKLPIPLLTLVNSPALLIELPSPEKFGYDSKTREKLVNSILRGIVY
jgi:N-acetylmuramoyl-L-alanine amidase